MMDLTEDLFKLIQIALIVVGVLAIYFSYMSYNVTINVRSTEREALILGNSLLSNDCITDAGTKSLFSEDKLNNMLLDATCLKKQYPYGTFRVELLDLTKKWEIVINSTSFNGEAKFNVVVINTTGEINPALMTVYV